MSIIVNNVLKSSLTFLRKPFPNGACQRCLHIDQVVDLEKYPLLEAESDKYRDLVTSIGESPASTIGGEESIDYKKFVEMLQN